MKIIHPNQTQCFKNGENCVAIEYPLGDRDINGAVISLSGRYPEKGRVVNLKCKELAYVIRGSGKIVLEDEVVDLDEGDLILIESGERYFWDGNLTMFVPCVPAWYSGQHEEVD